MQKIEGGVRDYAKRNGFSESLALELTSPSQKRAWRSLTGKLSAPYSLTLLAPMWHGSAGVEQKGKEPTGSYTDPPGDTGWLGTYAIPC